MATTDIIPLPHDRDTERAVLSTLMAREGVLQAMAVLDPSIFYYQLERDMAEAIASVIADGKKATVGAVIAWLQAHARNVRAEEVLEIYQTPATAAVKQDIARLEDMARRREAWRIMQEGAKMVLSLTNDPYTAMTDTATRLQEIQATKDDGISSMAESLEELRTVVRENSEGKRKALRTGFPLFDDHFLLRPGTLTVIAAFTSVGKTSLALNIAKAVARENTAVAYYSLEMGKAELAARIIAEDMNTTSAIILNKKLDDSLMAAFEQAAESNSRLPLYIDERSTLAFDETIRSIRTMTKAKGVKLVVIDYLQIYAQTTENVEATLAAMARQAKNVAMETKCSVILLSQLNRSDDTPSIKMLRGSGQIEESADNIVLIDRPAAYPGYDTRLKTSDGKVKGGNFDGMAIDEVKDTACLILAKGRGVGTGRDFVTFQGDYTRFLPTHMTEQEKEEQEKELPF